MDSAPMSGEERAPSLDRAFPLGDPIVEVLVDTRRGRRVNEAAGHFRLCGGPLLLARALACDRRQIRLDDTGS